MSRHDQAATATSLSLDPAQGRIVTSAIWGCVDQLIDQATTLTDLIEHRLELLAARRWRALGEAVPAELVERERGAALMTITAPLLLEKIRLAFAGPIVLFKGPEVATRYPDPSLRPYGDLDILVPDARAAQEALIAAGFQELGDPALFVDIHHLRPLALPPFPLLVEVHARPKWIDALEPPPAAELIAAAVPSRLDVDGISTLRPDHHALVLVAHAWGHEPLRRISELVDVAAMTENLDRDELQTLARKWKMERVWNTTLATADALLSNDSTPEPLPLRLWARNLPSTRSRTVFESHLERWIAGFWALPVRAALRAAASSAVRSFAPEEGETWGEKLARTRLAFRNASTPRSEHDRALEERRRR
ncbi:MAG: hypothetical protein QOE13_1941 [Gaiellaceae bacterium]|nr:hypothetical protein [Gaiellaceae bacterium]